ncbi:hypothetical protein KAM260_16710 [Klebsiella pneumoniae]|nr:hypothetical protein WP5W18E06_23900 [Klebsiella quasipneumoniae]BCH43780.1 hypothetical protein KAM260_16710 [Klebsiella pneumoniae]
MGRYDELNRPRSFVFSAVNQLLCYLGKLSDKDLLHLWMQVCFRFFNEDQMYAWLSNLSTKRLIEASQLQKDEY